MTMIRIISRTPTTPPTAPAISGVVFFEATYTCTSLPLIIIIIIIMVAQPARAVASLHHHVHGRQHASRGLQLDVWNRFAAGRATCSVSTRWATPRAVRRSVE